MLAEQIDIEKYICMICIPGSGREVDWRTVDSDSVLKIFTLWYLSHAVSERTLATI